MNTQQLETFIEVAEHLNFARAAEQLNITTSAVSRQIHSLEEELDTKLFHRSTKSVRLTPAGIIFLNDAKEILAKLALTTQKMKTHSETSVQLLSIGCSNGTDSFFLSKLLSKCREQFPEIHPFLRIVSSRLLLNMLIHDEINILFGYKDNLPMRDEFCYYELAQIPVCCTLSTDDPMSLKKELSESDLLEKNLVICNSYEIPSQVTNVQNLLSHKFAPSSIYYSENLYEMLTLVKAGYGIGILPQMLYADNSLAYIPLVPDITLSYGVFYKQNVSNPVLKKFLSYVKTFSQDEKKNP